MALGALRDFVIVCWLGFMAYWAVSAATAKRTVRDGLWSRTMLVRIAVAMLIVIGARSGGLHRLGLGLAPITASPVWHAAGALGAVLCVAGLAFAVWARRHLGRNWGMPMSVKENPELVSSGPYALVRHPIYGGVIVAMVGSALVVPLIFGVPALLAIVYFVFSARTEERNLARLFPDAYPAYRQRTKMLIPYVI
jgi:protein-S-isoprenylcysteine O-methyltransferase Ste14